MSERTHDRSADNEYGSSPDRERLNSAVALLSPENPFLRIIKVSAWYNDGIVIWVDRSSRAYFDEQGKMLRIVGMIADITDRVRAEEELRQKDKELSEAERLNAVEVAGTGMRQNDVATWSEELYRIFGRDPNSALRRVTKSKP